MTRKTEMTGVQFEAWMNKHELYRDEAAKMFGVSESCINHWVRGIRGIPRLVQNLCKLIDADKIPVSVFF